MKVLLISQCTKNALTETRRIIDQFAERKGDCTWETQITEQGLETLKKILRATARRNTAVSCHLLKGLQQSQLLWIVGNNRRFNRNGAVPTNITSKDLLRADDEDGWHTIESIAILTSIAALFHDFGKSNDLFQKKLKGKSKKSFEPYRHEWISLILFKQFVGNSTDEEWLEKLTNVSEEENLSIPKTENIKVNPLKNLPPIAKFVGWLILSHHRLPVSKGGKQILDTIDKGMDGSNFNAKWNSYNCDDEWKENELEQVKICSQGVPFKSSKWRLAAKKAATHALRYYDLINKDWFQERFSMHLARVILMLSDHLYSSVDPTIALQDVGYNVYANTYLETNKLKQKLDEHNISVAKYAYLIAKRIPRYINNLPSITLKKIFKQRSLNKNFSWQDSAIDLATSLKKQSFESGFFGVNLASTGAGKTLANAKIMYALSDEKKGCRFNIALGLRILTLQTGRALREKLHLSNDELATVIGSQAFQKLHELRDQQQGEIYGSESVEDIVDDEDEIDFDDSTCFDDGYISRYVKNNNKLKKIIEAPILVSTIDHLISATESQRGGKQIVPILRLLSSDLVLDEPDDFDVEDLPALCRLVNFAGVFGSRVLLSSATLPPSIIKALFEAYMSGRSAFNRACKQGENRRGIACAWFDEHQVFSSTHKDKDSYLVSHTQFIDKRIEYLEKQKSLRKAELQPIKVETNNLQDTYTAVANVIKTSIYQLHDQHHQIHPASDKKVSIGLVRMANINPMIEVVKEFLSWNAEDNYTIHVCVYHSQHTLIVRSKLEAVLDNVLMRHDPHKLWSIPDIINPLNSSKDANHIFLVFGTAVTEVGRDHDYDWAIIEPSSMRSIIQLAGRVQRHRQIVPSSPNLKILQRNIKGLCGSDVAFSKPGFENDSVKLHTNNLEECLKIHQYQVVDAIPRLRCDDNLKSTYTLNLVALEHYRMEGKLLGCDEDDFSANQWWTTGIDWCFEHQRHSEFRKSQGKTIEYIELLEDATVETKMHVWPKENNLKAVQDKSFEKSTITLGKGMNKWICVDAKEEIIKLSEIKSETTEKISLQFSRIILRELKDGERWIQDPFLGFYQLPVRQ